MIELIPAKAKQIIAIAKNIMKYRRFTAHVKLIKKDNITIDIPIAIAIPKRIEFINILVFKFHSPLKWIKLVIIYRIIVNNRF